MDETVLKYKEEIIILLQEIKIKFAYIFGSSVKGNFRKESDIDIAVYIEEDIDDYTVFMKAQEIAMKLNRDIDLVNLKKVSTVFAAQIISTGELIMCGDINKKMEFEMNTLSQYAKLNEERVEILKHYK